jgi:Porphyromonas-type peptidyl-arginine deiminase
MPAEWEPHDAVWLGWGKNKPLYHPVAVDIIKNLTPHVKVKITVSSYSVLQVAKSILRKSGIDTTMIEFHTMIGSLYWIRDHGATFLVNEKGELGVADFNWSDYGLPGWIKEKYDNNPDSDINYDSNYDDVDDSCEGCDHWDSAKIYPKDNYMSYNFVCQNKFTEGQAKRMCDQINLYRSSLAKPNTIGCDNICNIIIQTNTTYDTPKTVVGNIYLKSGVTLTISSLIEFGQNKSIFVENGGKLVLQGTEAMLAKCPQATYWAGINVGSSGEVEVRGGSQFIVCLVLQ